MTDDSPTPIEKAARERLYFALREFVDESGYPAAMIADVLSELSSEYETFVAWAAQEAIADGRQIEPDAEAE